MLAEADLDTGKVGEWKTIWEGTGGSVSIVIHTRCLGVF